ncbi:prepilin peptidase [Nocardioides sp. dk4132]|uniref:prepilin peptidase n=1 Tax=unclassified Nocardioides TaxID=2615069 RepID=UPI001297CF2B|nr:MULTISPECIES: A24 family peptidase [unclassified Nocardioides]MQW76342.1 prepilin peptidase [Nocardioides sp. dk4132]QGA07379.1 prepilin peptidase [Nocardioides sp. dk884]
MTIVVAAACALLAGLVLQTRLARAGYRYDDERHLPRRECRWVAPVLAVAVGLLAWRAEGEVVVLLAYAAVLAWMVGLAVIDLDVRRLPDRWTLPSYPAVAVLLAGCTWASETGWSAWVTALVCGVVNGAVHLLLAVLNPAGLGLGDVKLAVTLGMVTGWFGWPAAFAAFLGAFCLGLVVGLVAVVRTGAGRKATFPFGPAMLGAAALVVLAAVPSVA